MASATNNANIDFPTTVAAMSDATHFSLEAGGTVKVRGTITGNPDALGDNEFYRITANSLTFTIADDALINDADDDAINGVLGTGNITIYLHNADPGTTGANNRITNASVTVANSVFDVS